MFERFTNSARRVIVLAQREARTLKHDHIGPHHVLLGVLTADDATGGAVLAALGVEPEGVRRQVLAKYGQGVTEMSDDIPFSTDCKKIHEHSLRESLQLGHNYIGSEHLVLGLISGPSADTGQLLTAVGVRTDAVRNAVMDRLGSAGGAEPTEP